MAVRCTRKLLDLLARLTHNEEMASHCSLVIDVAGSLAANRLTPKLAQASANWRLPRERADWPSGTLRS